MATTVSVDNDFARFGSKSYAINKINSVEVRTHKPHGTLSAFLCGILGLLMLLSWLGSSEPAQGSSSTTLGVAVLFLALAYWRWTLSKRRDYRLFLMTSSSETQAITSADGQYIEDLRGKIEAAMADHSRRGSAG